MQRRGFYIGIVFLGLIPGQSLYGVVESTTSQQSEESVLLAHEADMRVHVEIQVARMESVLEGLKGAHVPQFFEKIERDARSMQP